MTALLLALLALLPDAASRRYRVEIGGQPVGVATLTVRCDRARCTAAFETALRVPDAGGGGVARRRVNVTTDRAGALLEAEAGGKRRKGDGEAVASILVEAVLSSTPEGQRRCLRVEDVETGRSGTACATRRGAWLEGEVLGEPVRFRAGSGDLPVEVLLPGQETRFVADPAAEVPARAPATFGSAVPAPPGAEISRDL
ncbi:MAG: transglutaminase domain-containing protein, partial [Deltaproteobacteria bacterium]